MEPLTIVKITEIFLVPSSILVGALGVARTEGLKTGISALALLTTVIWIVSNWDAHRESPTLSLRLYLLVWLPVLFLVAWVIAAIVHYRKWRP